MEFLEELGLQLRSKGKRMLRIVNTDNSVIIKLNAPIGKKIKKIGFVQGGIGVLYEYTQDKKLCSKYFTLTKQQESYLPENLKASGYTFILQPAIVEISYLFQKNAIKYDTAKMSMRGRK